MMEINRAQSERQAESGAVLLGREIPMEDLFELFRRDAGALVRYSDLNQPVAERPRLDRQIASVGHRLDRIPGQIAKRLAQQSGVGDDLLRSGIELIVHGDS